MFNCNHCNQFCCHCCKRCKDGLTPFINYLGNWQIGDNDTQIPATGTPGSSGKDGITPQITANAVSVPSTSPANVIQSGTTENPILTFEIPQGKDGINGTDGSNGKSAYDIAIENGFVGTEQEWLDSLVGANGKDGVDGSNGLNGEDGKSAYDVAVANGFVGTEAEWLASLKGKDGVDGKDGAAGLTPRVYHADLSKVGNQIEIWLDGIRGQWIYRDATSISFNIHSGSSNNVIVDLKRSTQYDGAAVEGSTLDNFTLTSAYQSVDTIIYNSSREMHRTWIRTKDPTTGLWSLFQIDLFVSNGGARTDVIVWTIYTNASL